MQEETIIVGAGACGLMCAVQAGFLGKKVVVLEKNDKAGAKILISGGGRCNFTNLYTTPENFISAQEHFCKSALSQWSVEDTISFFRKNGIEGAEKTLGQLFPLQKNAKDVVRIFTNYCLEMGQKIIYKAELLKVYSKEGFFELDVNIDGKTQKITCKKLVMASGGLPIPKMGATGIGMDTAKDLGIKLTKTFPALVPLVINHQDRPWFSDLSGTSVFAKVSNELISFEENILFTHWGLSGPAILQISSYHKQGQDIEIDFLPGTDIAAEIEKDRLTAGKKQLGNYLAGFIPTRLSEALGKFLPNDKKLASIGKKEVAEIRRIIHHFRITPAGDKGYEKAEVMKGGVDTTELNPHTLESKKIQGLFFGGECVDVTGWLGGYNFQWAWASGFVIAQNL